MTAPDFSKYDGKRTPYENQQKALDELSANWDKYQAHAIEAPTACHKADDNILMVNGSIKQAKDIVVGDILIGPDGSPRVVKKLVSGVGRMYKVTSDKFDTYTVSEGHLLCIYRTPEYKGQPPKFELLPVEAWLDKSRWFKHIRYVYRAGICIDFHNEYQPHVSPYVLGCYISDGSQGLPNFTKPYIIWDDILAQEARRFNLVLKSRWDVKRHTFIFTITDKKGQGTNPFLQALTEDLSDGYRRIPLKLKTASKEIRLNLLAGILDGDGYYDSAKGAYEVTFKQKELSEDVRFLCLSLGLYVSKSAEKMVSLPGWEVPRPYYRLHISGDLQQIPCKIKIPHINLCKKNQTISKFNVISVGVGDYYGWEVDQDHLYLLSDMQVIHNCGKTFLAHTIQKATNGAFLTCNNVLVDQFASEYKLPRMIGQENYATHGAYESSIMQSLDPENLVCYNPMSFRFAMRRPGFRMPKCIIIDEAHAALSLLKEVTTQIFRLNRHEYFRFDLTDPQKCIKWLLNKIADIQVQILELNGKKLSRRRLLEARIFRLEDLVDMITIAPEQYAIWTEANSNSYYLLIKPLNMPPEFSQRYFKDSKIILLSATLTASDCREMLGGRKYNVIKLPSPISPERRRIYFTPIEEVLSYPTNTLAIAQKIDEILRSIDIRPCLIHCTYADAKGIYQHLKTPVLIHDKDTKVEVLKDWMNKGGVLLGSGLSEGLDLVGDLCRLNIVTKLQYPSLAGDFWKKKIALPGGQYAYELDTMKHVIQASGRVCRTPFDFGITLILDSRFPKLYTRLRDEIPDAFKSAIIWTKTSYSEINKSVDKLKLT